MSLTSVSPKRPGRVYHRHFDHDEARRLRADGWTWQALIDRFGVSETALRRVIDPKFREKFDKRTLRWMYENRREPCKGGCGELVWMTSPERSGYCHKCLGRLKAAVNVRPDELRCTKCGEWKPDSGFYRRTGKHLARRGRKQECKKCEVDRRREHRRRRPEMEARTQRRQTQKRREKRLMRYIVFQPNGAGFKEVARVEAGSPAHAVEQAANEAGEYVAVPEGRFKVMRVAPIESLRVVAGVGD